MKIIKVCGGLGNQMFQYAKAYSIICDNEECMIDTSGFKNYKLHNGYELDALFKLKIDEANKDEVNKVKDDSKRFIDRLRRNIFGRRSTHVMEGFALGSIAKDMYLDGYWQNDEGLRSNEEEMKQIFQFKKSLSAKSQGLIDNLKSNIKISIHVRRGDYLNKVNDNIYAKCDREYYNNAIKFFQKKYTDFHLLVFSNDINWCVKEFGDLKNIHFIDWNVNENSYEDMIMMSLCNHNIIANSSFSWWGAFLNSNVNKDVIYPKYWLNGKESQEVVYIPKNYIQINND